MAQNRAYYIGVSLFPLGLTVALLVMKLIAMHFGLTDMSNVDIGRVRDITLLVVYAAACVVLTIIWQFSNKLHFLPRILIAIVVSLVLTYILFNAGLDGYFQKTAELLAAWANH